MKYPEWTQAVNAARHIAKVIERHLAHTHTPHEGRLRHSAARAPSREPCDLHARHADVASIGTTQNDVTRMMILDIRKGKCAKRSGPYQVGTAISKNDAAMLQKLCSQAPQTSQEDLCATPDCQSGLAPDAEGRRPVVLPPISSSRNTGPLGKAGDDDCGHANDGGAHVVRDNNRVSGTSPPAPQRGRGSAGHRRRPPPDQELFGKTAPDPEEFGISCVKLFHELRRMRGESVLNIGPVHTWPLHLKHVTLVDLDTMGAVQVEHPETQQHLTAAFQLTHPERFAGFVTAGPSRSQKNRLMT
jgi:hypothetical protein